MYLRLWPPSCLDVPVEVLKISTLVLCVYSLFSCLADGNQFLSGSVSQLLLMPLSRDINVSYLLYRELITNIKPYVNEI